MSWFTSVLLLLLLIYLGQAKVAPDITAREDLGSSDSKRTLFSIVWGCAATTIICAWAAIHPNIAPREGPFKRTLRRLELMFWTIVAPEILPCWALNQSLAAITVRDVYNIGKGYGKKKRGIWESVRAWFSLDEIKGATSPVWTIAHGHFLIMGGFHVIEPPEDGRQSKKANTDTQRAEIVEETKADAEHGDVPPAQYTEGRVTILTLEMLRELVKDPEFEIRMAEDEISDRSKGDALSKLIFLVQSTWFILQCLGRRIQGLDLTQLELTTLALASLNGITFALWWAKPLGAQAIVRVYMKRKMTESERVPVKKRSMRSETIREVPRIFKKCATTIRDGFLCQSSLIALVTVPSAILFLLLSPLVAFTSIFFATASDLLEGTSSVFPPDDTRVPTFYVPKHENSRWLQIALLLSLSAAFGGIHCSGWDYLFPSSTEQILWRVASLAVTILPTIAFPLGQIVLYPPPFQPPSANLTANQSYKPLRLFGGVVVILLAFGYAAARVMLLGLAVSLLRHLPQTAFVDINWTVFYPHMF